MKATEASLLDFVRKSQQFIIPIYQRTYSWTEQECRQLWKDIIRTGENDDVPAHFVGSITYIHEGIFQVMDWKPLLVIDGQQRLTTLVLILEALARRLDESSTSVDEISARKLRNRYLVDPDEEGDRHFKLLLTQTDKKSLLNLMRGSSELSEQESSIRIMNNFAFFQKRVSALNGELGALWKGLSKLIIVDIALSRDDDNPQLIFESMNSTGRKLSQADLIRNFILMGLDPSEQTRLYEEHWRPMEVDFGQKAYSSRFDDFVRHYLTVKSGGDIPKVGAVYESFKQYAQKPDIETAGIDALVADVHEYAKYYCAVVLGKEPDTDLAEAFRDISDLKVYVATPFLLELYSDYKKNRLTKHDLVTAVRLTESYVFRRAVCAIPTNSLNKTFATFGRVLKKDRYLESIQAHFLTLPSYRRFPDDEEFMRELSRRDLYNFPRRSYWLRRVENHNRRERVHVDEYTIEHIMPQNENLSSEWQAELGADWEDVWKTWLHTLGNLTLTGYNSEYSDHPFARKRDMPGGFRDSPLYLNQGLGDQDVWNKDAIQERACRLAQKAVQVWLRPELSAEVLNDYAPKSPQARTTYTIEDHAHLSPGSPMRTLFDTFREAVLKLDPCVTEQFLKLYVAFKGETNFVDVIPQMSKLRLVLNMRFDELHDRKQIARDITNVGRWGNGDVEIDISNREELPYVMGLVRQAFESQMGDGRE